MTKEYIAVLDFGSQYTHLIAKRLRHQGFYTEIHSPASPLSNFINVKGLILSGGPASVSAHDTPDFNRELLNLEVPILGLCYGHQLLAKNFGGSIINTGKGEFGKAFLRQVRESPIWEGLSFPSQVWMSHQDSVIKPPDDFRVIGDTESGDIAAMVHRSKPIFTFQFHPEVTDSLEGLQMLKNFSKLTGLEASWSMEGFVNECMEEITRQVGKKRVLMFLSGGVDSSVAFALVNQALGQERVLGLYIDNGFMRKNETKQIIRRYSEQGFTNIEARDYSKEFLNALKVQVDPQLKRQRVGAEFILVREKFLMELGLNADDWMLGQGTLYPDIIESGGSEHASVIKSHHNRVDEVIQLMYSGQVIEPLKDLYKDEVRKLGTLLGLQDSIVWRHPFPGPGLSINVLCSNGKEKKNELRTLKESLSRLFETNNCGTGVLPIRSVGVQGDQRTYNPPGVLWNTPKDWAWLEEQSIRITNTIPELNRVVLLLTPDELPELKIREAYCTRERLDLLREADSMVTKALEEKGVMKKIFQLLVILLPLSVNGSGNCLVIRPVCSDDVMTAQFARLDWELVEVLKKHLIQLPEIEGVFYDITHKPPATFGWE